jgi:hypothetical protein
MSRVTIRNSLYVLGYGLTVVGIGFIVWAVVVWVQVDRAVGAIELQAKETIATNRAMIRLTERVDLQVEMMLLVRDRMTSVENRLAHLEDVHHQDAEYRAPDK